MITKNICNKCLQETRYVYVVIAYLKANIFLKKTLEYMCHQQSKIHIFLFTIHLFYTIHATAVKPCITVL